MRYKCKKCSEIFANVYKKTVFIQIQTKNIIESRKAHKRIYKRAWKRVGYLCEKCGTMELVKEYYNIVKQPITMYKPPKKTKKTP